MTLRDAIIRAVDTCDVQAAAVVSDMLRAKGLSYTETLAFVRRVRPEATEILWEGLMYEADELGL